MKNHKISEGRYYLNDLIKQKVASSLVRYVYQQSYVGQFTSLFCATVIFIACYDTYISHFVLSFWYGFFILVVIFRLILAKAYFIADDTDQNVKLWKDLFIVGTLLGGLCWGLAGSVIFAQANSTQQTLIILILAGITAGASPLLCAELTSSLVFISCVLIPLIFRLAYFGDNTTYSLFSITVVAYYCYLVIVSLKLHRTIKESISLKFENDVLLETVSHAKNQLEISNEKLTEVATHDPLTSAANRSLFTTTLLEAIKRAKISGRMVALLYIDLDNFKDINDVYGHSVGDILLVKVIERLRENLREGALVARLGGDELTVILEDIKDIEIVFGVAKLVCVKLAIPYPIQDHTLTTTASIGVSIYPVDGHDADSLLKAADSAMYYVKVNGRNNYHFSEEVIRSNIKLTDRSNNHT